jgi:hypothetical protein
MLSFVVIVLSVFAVTVSASITETLLDLLQQLDLMPLVGAEPVMQALAGELHLLGFADDMAAFVALARTHANAANFASDVISRAAQRLAIPENVANGWGTAMGNHVQRIIASSVWQTFVAQQPSESQFALQNLLPLSQVR